MAAAVIVEVLAGGRLVAALPPPPPEPELLPTRDVIASFPPPPPLQSPVRKAVAAVLARSRLAAAAADALMYLWIAGLAAMAASHVAVRVQGEGSRANAVALQVSLAASLVVLPVVPVALSLHAIRIAVSGTGEDTEPDKLSGMLHHVLRFIEIHPLVKSGEIDTVGLKRSAVKMDKDLEDDSC
uniref:Uncharacterized protein n=1 Tax=Oryza glumipatula TaxID=40148 RepID=A0A0E0AVD7_9ORYZ